MQNENLKILVGVCFVIGLIAFGIEYFRVSDDMQVNVKAYSEIKDKSAILCFRVSFHA